MLLFAAQRPWPDALDLVATFVVVGGLLAASFSGHVLMVLDVRNWLKSLRRALIVVVDHLPNFPGWARLQTPRCLMSLGLKLPCNEEQLLARYRSKVKQFHPDRGGDRKRFLRLQADFEEAREFLRGQ
jgi:hypothetical protein